MNIYLLVTVLLLQYEFIVCPPVTEKPPEPAPSEEPQEDLNFGLEYERYLKEIVGVLESDESFRKKLEESNITDIKSGEIARHLDFVGHGIRTQLDEIKRKEVDRLRQIIRLQSAMKKGTNDDDDDDSLRELAAGDKKGMKDVNINVNLPDIDKTRLLAHLDHSNPNSFEIEDLSKLIRQATKDLEDIDVKRRDEFKSYEMEKEYLRQKELDELDANKRAEEEKKFAELKQKHAKHPDVHHPGAEAQLQEVWEEGDGLNKKDFDPRTFFYLHDTNGDGVLDEPEVEALFQKELDKVYDPNAPEDDMMERYEEMNRMREHVMNEVDKDHDKLISLEEFLDSTKQSEFKKDEGWDTLEKQKVFSDEELAEFEKQYEELKRQNAQNEQHRQPSDHLQGPGPGAQGDVNVMHQGGVVHPQTGLPVAQEQHKAIEQEQPVVHEPQQQQIIVQQPPQQVPQQEQQHQPVVQEQPQPIHQEQPVVHNEPQVVHHEQPVVHDQPQVVHQEQPVVHNPPQEQPAVHDQPQAVHGQPVVNEPQQAV